MRWILIIMMPLPYGTALQHLRETAEACGIQGCTLHLGRRSTATHLAQQASCGEAEDIVQTAGGWSHKSTTAATYAKRDRQLHRAASLI